jgi:hypothetical protein
MLAPVIPLPIITTSAVAGRSLVDRWPRSRGEGSVCQKDLLEFGVGSPAGWPSLGRSGIVRAMVCDDVSWLCDVMRCGEAGRAGVDYNSSGAVLERSRYRWGTFEPLC